MYSFRDLVALKVVKSLLDGGMSLQRVRRAWDYLNRRAALDRHLSEVKLITDGVSIFKVAKRNEEVLDALREGQMAFFLALDEVARSVDERVAEYLYDREEFITALKRVETDIEAALSTDTVRRLRAAGGARRLRDALDPRLR